MSQIVHLMVGNIGTGKTVTTKRLMSTCKNILVLDIDPIIMMLGAESYSPEMLTDRHRNLYGGLLRILTAKLLYYKFDVIIDVAAMPKKICTDFISVAKTFNARVKVYLHKTLGGLERRYSEDNRGESDEVWKQVYENFEKEYDEPSLDEGINEIIDCTRKENGR